MGSAAFPALPTLGGLSGARRGGTCGDYESGRIGRVRINGKSFLIVLGLVTLALAVLTLWLWPRLAGRGARPVAGRIGLLLGTQLSLTATFLFTVNALGGFYTSWGQLFGSASSHYHLTNAGTAGPSKANGDQLSVAAGSGKGKLTGVRSGLSAQLAVFTPAGYASAAGAAKSGAASPASADGGATAAGSGPALAPGSASYPVEVVDLTGGDGGQQLPDFQQIADQYKMIVAVVTDSSSGKAIPGVNVPNGPQGELFWSQDLRTALEARYRVDAAPADWAVAGVGESGTAAVNLAVQDSTRYGLAAAVGDWTSTPAADSWPGIDRYLSGAPAPAVRLLYNAAAPSIPAKIRSSDGPLLVAGQSGLDLAGALDWLGASIDANGERS